MALVACALGPAAQVWAQQAPAELALQPSPRLRETFPPEVRGDLPTFVEGGNVSGRTGLETVIEGDAVLRRGDTIIRGDRLEYHQPEDLARARGNVRINKAGNTYEGPLLEMKVDAFQGFFDQPRYRFLRNGAYGQADRVDFIDNDRSVVRNATYTTCQREPESGWSPAWILTAERLNLDNESETGVAYNAALRFFGVPILPIPVLSFPLTDKRKSGFLPPTIGVDSVSGAEVTVPYYWNIAPNRDATFSPTVMSKRGLDLGGQFRYLENSYSGQLDANYLPDDQLRDRDRWSYHLRHDQAGVAGVPGLGLNLNLNRVSDDNYWRDFTSRTTTAGSLTERLLASDGVLSWGAGRFSMTARALKWQTLQDPQALIVPPYDRLPQLVGRYTRQELPGGFAAYAETDYTHFRSDRVLNNQPNAQRAYTLAQLSRPWQAPGWFVIPKLQLHATQYEFDAPLLANGRTSADRSVPTASLDGGLVFERDTALLGRNLIQTLEPRAFYVYTPFREQNFLPNYDSAYNDFNFATIYTENAFGGNDRIADNNLLTLGVSTRFLAQETGAELARFGIAQRLRFKDQRVVLPGTPPVTERLSDVLLGASLNWDPRWAFDSTVQYNPKTSRSIRSTIGARYNPGNYRVVSAAYRLQRGFSEQVDIGWQWPINDLWGDRGRDLGPGRGQGGGRWYSVGRVNVSLRERRVVDTIIGVEYDACCWIGRVLLERLQYSPNSSNKRILFQIEFIGFTRLGTNALGTLRDNIPRYQFLREQVDPPSRFTNYD
ncbi:organic solvent tolerance protein precursor-like protein [Ramlibacter tataouinensis TTB310]|uniref:LPS-assembly protein LptD n=1 Tax=Ramlibacter tataouinensis (strain ATCC BAA-407 / DSM 14655 / LMG 21543 / TTB310) TaxID=365046 RepID=F5Y325_RAMTT|nr:organic solvent tolerance protein precursor-like protein [Ramlibacter tataouinensis TTB310]